ncbi:stage V sporulation protein B [Paenibacillus crassostreae]|uniref:Stage V sporulation protein B n=1 Tax=Paenibacillus crassostreae TaxID=1763538 RepID=A0A167CH99_9BACL|nr:stage V sporulation protein B [Paenibacillus crassostreae]AOZ91882.1 stage V sporulation protein B [Paenibacillus crassostreae]OAB73194.1 stage V sporulation protein B [Paenibacillus crassostreae]
MNKYQKQTFIQGTLILLSAGIINRILGFIPRIALPRIIGAEGVGIYQLGYPFFLVIMTLITGGIPLAVSKLVSEAEIADNPQASRNVLRISFGLTFGLGILFMFLSIWFAPWVTQVILTDPRVYHTFVSMSPMLVIVAISSVFRGYFQGKQNMIPSAVSSIVETVVRIICVLCFSFMLLPKGIEFGAAGAMLGVMAGEFVGLLILLYHYHADDKHNTSSNSAGKSLEVPRMEGGVLRRLLKITIPVTAGKLVGSFSYLFESIITAQSLALAGFATSVATAQYGALQGMIIPLLLLPGALTTSLAVSLVPSLSEAAARNEHATIHKRLNQTINIALVTGAPFSVLMFILSAPLCLLLYSNQEISGMLQLMAPFTLFIYIQAPLQVALQVLDHPGKALRNTLIGAIIKLFLIWYLSSQPEYGIYGAVIAIIINSIIVTLLHGFSVTRLLSFKFNILNMLKICFAMLLMGIGVQLAYTQLPFHQHTWLQFLISCVIGFAIYMVIIFRIKLVSIRDIEKIPIIGQWLPFK